MSKPIPAKVKSIIANAHVHSARPSRRTMALTPANKAVIVTLEHGEQFQNKLRKAFGL